MTVAKKQQPKPTSALAGLEQEAADLTVRRTQCHVGRLFDWLDPADIDLFRKALKNTGLTSTALSKALKGRVEPDLIPSVPSLQRHRSGACNCEA